MSRDAARLRVQAYAERNSHSAPAFRDALYAVLDLHPRSLVAAGVIDGRGKDGQCSYCQDRDERPLRVYRDHLNGAKTKTWMHDHEDSYPVCVECSEGYDGHPAWPCPTVRAITSHFPEVTDV
jgi:hypothetical protein